MGGGFIGVKFSQAMRRFGGKVTVIERNHRMLHTEDDDVTERGYIKVNERLETSAAGFGRSAK